MLRKVNSYDNAIAENFFSILKTECIYRHKPRTFQEANDLIDRYIHFYNHARIQNKTGVAPLTFNISYLGAFFYCPHNLGQFKTEDEAKALVQRFIESSCASRELLVSLIERIELSEDKRLYIKFRFKQLNSEVS